MMFRKCLLAGLLFIVFLPCANSQSLTFDGYANQLLFNIFKDQPDTAIRPFLRSYVPSLLDKKITPADLGSSGGSKNQYSFEIHSFLFTTVILISTIPLQTARSNSFAAARLMEKSYRYMMLSSGSSLMNCRKLN
jgi:hypothetical protein